MNSNNDFAKTILLVEDNDDIRFLVQSSLEREGYKIVACETGRDLNDELCNHAIDLVLLDLMLPDVNGIDLIDKIREVTMAPIIILSAKTQLVERVIGLEAGADDYISKPFQIEDLIARVRAHIRRFSNKNVQTTKSEITFGQFTMNVYSHQVYDGNQREIAFTAGEFLLLQTLISSPGRTYTREQLLNRCRRDHLDVTERVIDTQIARIRKKLNDAYGNGNIIKSIRGVGYCFYG